MRNASRIIILGIGAAAIGGCTNLDGTPNRAATGGLIGTGTGALIGNLLDDDAGAVVGGALGGLAGTAIGGHLDRQQRELEQALGGTGATVVNTGQELVVTLPEAITFDVDSATVEPGFVDELALVAGSLRDNPASTVRVIGHTDNTGSAEHNQGLSERRATAVAGTLTGNGVEAWRVETAGVGFSQPIASNDTPAGRAQNRRVEVVITPTAPA